jgi:hypothetical protein
MKACCSILLIACITALTSCCHRGGGALSSVIAPPVQIAGTGGRDPGAQYIDFQDASHTRFRLVRPLEDGNPGEVAGSLWLYRCSSDEGGELVAAQSKQEHMLVAILREWLVDNGQAIRRGNDFAELCSRNNDWTRVAAVYNRIPSGTDPSFIFLEPEFAASVDGEVLDYHTFSNAQVVETVLKFMIERQERGNTTQ